MKILHVVGARPNFMKIAPLIREFERRGNQHKQVLVHTGQHYEYRMSKLFFEDLRLPEPDLNLDVGSGTHAQQTAQVMLRFEPALIRYAPDWVIVVGDVNSTLAAALVCKKVIVKVAHVEAGLRSFDLTMPEEINRVVTDQLSDLHFATEHSAVENLIREGIPRATIHLVGNVMIDSLVAFLPGVRERLILQQLELMKEGSDAVRPYVLLTVHRPINVDDPSRLANIVAAMNELARDIDVIFPMHPRTRQALGRSELPQWNGRVTVMDPLGYLDFIALEQHAAVVVTDSGGVQEETTYFGVPCVTIRPNTERPVTLALGSNELVEAETRSIVDAVRRRLNSTQRRETSACRVPFWDGRAAERIVSVLEAVG